MVQRFRRGFSAAEKTELWDRWQKGESLKAIGRAFGKSSSSIYYQVAPHGGIRPAPRRRSRLALTLAEREEISRGIAGHVNTNLSRVAVMWDPATGSTQIKAIEQAAGPLNIKLDVLEIRTRSDFEGAFVSASQRSAGAAILLS